MKIETKVRVFLSVVDDNGEGLIAVWFDGTSGVGSVSGSPWVMQPGGRSVPWSALFQEVWEIGRRQGRTESGRLDPDPSGAGEPTS